MEIIKAQNITKKYPTGHGINEISLAVCKGQSFGVMGDNGSGKTTLTRLIAGLDGIQQGRLCVLGSASFPHSVAIRRRYGVALDTPAHWQTLTGRQNLLFFAQQYRLKGTALNQRTEKLLHEANLVAQADDPVSTWSFGMRRKLSIIQALAHNPELLILDEPSAGVDMTFLDRLAQWIQQRSEQGLTTWIADNDADWLARTATDVMLLSEGRIKAAGSVQALIESIDARYRITVQLTEPFIINGPLPQGVTNLKCYKSQITADLNSDPQLPTELLSWITDRGGHLRTMEVRSITLNEALRQYHEKTEVTL